MDDSSHFIHLWKNTEDILLTVPGTVDMFHHILWSFVWYSPRFHNDTLGFDNQYRLYGYGTHQDFIMIQGFDKSVQTVWLVVLTKIS